MIEQQTQQQTQSQSHGFIIENDIREKCFGLEYENNNTDRHDIPKEKNKHDENENCSIKTTGSNMIDCGDLLSFYGYDFDEKNTIIVYKYKQIDDNHKKLENIYEINYNKECHKRLFGDVSIDVLKEYVDFVKSIPKHINKDELKKYRDDYKKKKKEIQNKYKLKINISPKVDSKTQRRVQCSIPKFQELLRDYIVYESKTTHPEKPNMLRGEEIVLQFYSPKRVRK